MPFSTPPADENDFISQNPSQPPNASDYIPAFKTYTLPHDELYALPSAVDSNLPQPLLAPLPPVVNTSPPNPNTCPVNATSCTLTSPNEFFLVPNSTVNEVTKFLLSRVSSQMDLSIMLFNARSLLPKIHTLRAIIAVAQPSLICVTETWLSVDTPDTVVSIPGYNLHRSDRRNSRGGGCAIYSNTELRATPLDDPSLEGIPETTWISIEQTKRPVLVGCIYLPPPPTPASITDLSRIISTAHALPHSSKFVLGDFNLPDISWSPTLGPSRYASLLAQLSVEGWSQTVRSPTRGQHTLDLIFSNEGHLATTAVGPCFPGSDHCVVSCNAARFSETVPPRPSFFHLLTPDILLAFSSLLASRDWNDFFLSSDTQRICDIFYQNLLTSLYLASPIKSFYPGSSRHDKLLKALENKIRRAGREYRKSRDFSLILLINKLSTDQESLRVSLECREENTALRGPSSCKLLGRLFRGRCTPNCHQVTCLSSTNGSFITHPRMSKCPRNGTLVMVSDQVAVYPFAELGNRFANVSSPFEETPSVRDIITCEMMMSPRMVSKRLQTNYQARRADQESPDQKRIISPQQPIFWHSGTIETTGQHNRQPTNNANRNSGADGPHTFKSCVYLAILVHPMTRCLDRPAIFNPSESWVWKSGVKVDYAPEDTLKSVIFSAADSRQDIRARSFADATCVNGHLEPQSPGRRENPEDFMKAEESSRNETNKRHSLPHAHSQNVVGGFSPPTQISPLQDPAGGLLCGLMPWKKSISNSKIEIAEQQLNSHSPASSASNIEKLPAPNSSVSQNGLHNEVSDLEEFELLEEIAENSSFSSLTTSFISKLGKNSLRDRLQRAEERIEKMSLVDGSMAFNGNRNADIQYDPPVLRSPFSVPGLFVLSWIAMPYRAYFVSRNSVHQSALQSTPERNILSTANKHRSDSGIGILRSTSAERPTDGILAKGGPKKDKKVTRFHLVREATSTSREDVSLNGSAREVQVGETPAEQQLKRDNTHGSMEFDDMNSWNCDATNEVQHHQRSPMNAGSPQLANGTTVDAERFPHEANNKSPSSGGRLGETCTATIPLVKRQSTTHRSLGASLHSGSKSPSPQRPAVPSYETEIIALADEFVEKLKRDPQSAVGRTYVESQAAIRQWITRLESEVRRFKTENTNLLRLKAEREESMKRLECETKKFEEMREKERKLFSDYKENEMRKLKKERRVLDEYQRALKSMPAKKEREEIERLRDELQEARSDLSRREVRWHAAIARLRSRIEELEAERDELKTRVHRLEGDRIELQAQLNTSRSANGSLARTQIRRTASSVGISRQLSFCNGANALSLTRLERRLWKTLLISKGHFCFVFTHPIFVMLSGLTLLERIFGALSLNAVTQSIILKGSRTTSTETSSLPAVNKAGRSKRGNQPLGGYRWTSRSGSHSAGLDTLVGVGTKHRSSTIGSGVDRPLSARDSVSSSGRPSSLITRRATSTDGTRESVHSGGYYTGEDDCLSLTSGGNADTERHDNKSGIDLDQISPATVPVQPQLDRSALGPSKRSAADEKLPVPGTAASGAVVRSVKHPDGSSEETYANGATVISYANGSVKEVFPDRKTVLVSLFNGDIKRTLPDGRVIYHYAGDGTVQITYPDGAEEINYADGRQEIIHPKSTQKSQGENAVKLSGSELTSRRLPNGDREISLPNGQREVHSVTGIKCRIYPDGTTKTVFPDGRHETRYSSGRLRVKDAQGNLILDTRLPVSVLPSQPSIQSSNSSPPPKPTADSRKS
ncbi:hypothetical protein T265_00428 [Opisthorchis viverrini]|uniref:Centromere protein J C-terminal domain-containing protein n=1 Tax=Opisthorchis viverrini TaxID=6198 RepID=A0A075A610_OPIVI|nr:hypothetical protein T265_00428 [Opisthorchis viverrini]KER33742.1 hypothetical protein T265_00428 [Opisthorchis viverrini]